jgi:biopolymer transport protein ExbB/TolQ
MFLKILKITLFIGIFLSSLTIILTRVLPPSRIVIIIMLYMIVLSSLVSGMWVYFEIYVKPKRRLKKIERVIAELKKLNDKMEEGVKTFDKACYSKHQLYLLLEQSLSKIEEKIEKIEKEVMDKSMY